MPGQGFARPRVQVGRNAARTRPDGSGARGDATLAANPRTSLLRRSLAFLALLLAASGAHRLAADPPAQPTDFGEHVDVRIVNVDVYVLGKDGRPVAGLEASDFELFE